MEDALDLLYVDGPYAVSPTREGVLMPCIDATILLRKKLPIQHILFDNRISSLRHLLRSRAAEGYDLDLRERVDPDEVWPVKPIRHHSYLVRRT